MNIELPKKLLFLIEKTARYKIAYGGRGGAKSWAFAMCLIAICLSRKTRVLCTREYQNSIKQSVHKLLKDIIYKYNLQKYFHITDNAIKVKHNGSEFLFMGLHNNVDNVKSTEGVDYCWVEEAHKVTKRSWEILIPTIRKPGSEIWVSFNPEFEDDETYNRFITNPPNIEDILEAFGITLEEYRKQFNYDEFAIIQKVGWQDNPWFPNELKMEMIRDKKADYDRYLNIWEGECKRNSDAQIFKGKFEVRDFETPDVRECYQSRFFFGADWGFSTDPTAITRMFIKDNCLYIDYESGGTGVDIDDHPKLFDVIPEVRKWKIWADCARPETISYIKKQGFNIAGAKKWTGSIEDGIEYIKSFDKIIIHTRCKKTAEEFCKYMYKIDKNTEEVLPIIVDKWNHYIDSIRYALADYIKGKVSIFDVI